MRLAFIWNLGPFEVIVILLVALLLFGRRLPEVARSLGQGLVEFRKGLREEPDRPKPLPPTSQDAGSPTGEASTPPTAPPDGEARPDEEEDRMDGGDLAG
jgi:sec-independent protein translocase protein TatA